MKAELLHVFTPYANPMRWNNRNLVHNEFEKNMLEAGVKLTTIECTYGNRPYELLDHSRINRIRVRANTLVWNKENLLNLGIQRTPGAKYIAWIDGDVYFRKPGWAEETVNALQQYFIVQPWSDAYDLGPKGEHIANYRSFMRQWWHGEPVFPAGPNWWTFDKGPYTYPHSGYAWACTRQAYDWLGGLFELGAMGSGDHHMALSMVGRVDKSVPGRVSPSYMKHLLAWQNRAINHLNMNYGFLWGTIEHHWHGKKSDRKYIDRWQMIQKYQFDPDTDLKRNSFGVLELTGNKPGLAHDMDVYFRQRNEDSNSTD